MKKSVFKKHDKLVILLIIGIAITLLSWFVKSGTYSSTNEFVDVGYVRAGIFDFFYFVFASIYYKFTDLLYIIAIGGCYGVLAETKSYRKIVDKTIDFIHGKEKLVIALFVLLSALYISISSFIIVLFLFVPFVVTVLLGDGKDRLTALATAFGGIFVGFMAQTFGTYGMMYLNRSLLVNYYDSLLLKFILLALIYALYIVFLILHMNRYKKPVDEIKYDMFATEELDETDVKKKKKTKVWPTLVVFGICLLTILVAYVSWYNGFGITFFDDVFKDFNTKFLVVKEVPVLATLFGTLGSTNRVFGAPSSFGYMYDISFATFVILVMTLVVALLNKMSLAEILSNFGEGSKRISKVAVVYALCYLPLLVTTQYPWIITFINSFFVDAKFNVFRILGLGFLVQLLLVDQESAGNLLGPIISKTFGDHMIVTSIVWRFGYGLAMLLGPTSFILMAALSYLDIPYTKWLKFIWKFALSALVLFCIVICIVVYL